MKPKKSDEQHNVYDYDEIEAQFKVRYMTSMEAYMRLMSFPVVEMSHRFYAMSVHDEYGQSIVLEEGHEEEGYDKIKNDTQLTGFFKLCNRDAHAKTLTYDKIPYHYT